MIAPDAQGKIFLRNPEIRQDRIRLFRLLRRKYQHKGCNIRRRGKVEAAIAGAPGQRRRIHRKRTFIPRFHGHPAHCLLDPLAQPQLPEEVFFRRILPGVFTGNLQFFCRDRHVEGRIGFGPYGWVRPIVRLLRAINDRIERGIDLPPFQNVHCFLVDLVADGIGIIPCGCNQKVQRLPSGVAAAFGHNIKQLPVWLGVQFIKDHAAGVEAVFTGDICRQYLINAAGRLVDQALLRIEDFAALGQRRTQPYHIRRDVKDNRSLLPVGGAAVDLGALLAVAAGEQKRHRGGQLGFPLFLGDFNIGHVELPVSIWLDHTEQIADDLLLPWEQMKGFVVPLALGMLEALDERHGHVRQLLVIARTCRHEGCRRIFPCLCRRPSSSLWKSKGTSRRGRPLSPYFVLRWSAVTFWYRASFLHR